MTKSIPTSIRSKSYTIGFRYGTRVTHIHHTELLRFNAWSSSQTHTDTKWYSSIDSLTKYNFLFSVIWTHLMNTNTQRTRKWTQNKIQRKEPKNYDNNNKWRNKKGSNISMVVVLVVNVYCSIFVFCILIVFFCCCCCNLELFDSVVEWQTYIPGSCCSDVISIQLNVISFSLSLSLLLLLFLSCSSDLLRLFSLVYYGWNISVIVHSWWIFAQFSRKKSSVSIRCVCMCECVWIENRLV